MDEWVVVLHDNPESRRQYEACATLKPKGLQGIQCDLLENADARVCKELDSFPAFCHKPTNSCVYGVRTSTHDMEELVFRGAPQMRTTAPDPDPAPTAAP